MEMELERDHPKGRTEILFDFASSLHSEIIKQGDRSQGTFPIHQEQSDTLNGNIEIALRMQPVSKLDVKERFDALGTKLWNACTCVTKEDEKKVEYISYLARARVLSFFMLECASGSGDEDDCSDDIRLLKVALQTAKACIGSRKVPGLLELGVIILEKVSAREERLSKLRPDLDGGYAINDLSAEYQLLYATFTWPHGQIDIPERLLSQLLADGIQQDPIMVERFAELVYQIGEGSLCREEYSSATEWLQRSYRILSQPDLRKLHRSARNLRICVMHNLVRAFLQVGDEKAHQKALGFLDILEQDCGQRLSVLVLFLESISKQKTPDIQSYYDRLETIIRVAPVTKTNWVMILRQIHRLREWSLDLAVQGLESLLLDRLIFEKDDIFLQKAFVTYVWLQTLYPGFAEGLEGLTALISKLKSTWGSSLNVESSHASLVLLWKKISVAFESKTFDIAERWCLLAKDSFFENYGDANRTKIQRKLLLCALGQDDRNSASHLVRCLSESCKSETLTRYLIFKVALGDDNLELAKDCLEVLCQQVSGASTDILACMGEAQNSGKADQAMGILRQLLDNADDLPSEKLYPSVLLKCMIRLFISELSENQQGNTEIVGQICEAFERLHTTEASERFNQEWYSLSDLEWFSRNSYNLALQHCSAWESQHVLSLLNTCIRTLDIYPSNMGSEALSDLRVRRLMCNFLAAIINLTQGRIQPDPQIKTEYCLHSRRHIQCFRESIQSHIEQVNEEFHLELLDKYRILLEFDFEAAVQLKQWDNIDDLLAESHNVVGEKIYSVFADVMLCSNAPVGEITRTFQKIVQIIQERKLYDLNKMARWLRCLFQLAMKSNTQVAKEVLSQAYLLAQQASQQQQVQIQKGGISGYPEEELEWLSTTSYNRAIDLYLASEDASSRGWYEAARNLAKLMNDNQSLYGVLEEKFRCLSWDDE